MGACATSNIPDYRTSLTPTQPSGTLTDAMTNYQLRRCMTEVDTFEKQRDMYFYDRDNWESKNKIGEKEVYTFRNLQTGETVVLKDPSKNCTIKNIYK